MVHFRTIWLQLQPILWKSYVLRRRHSTLAVLEIVVPTLLYLICAIFASFYNRFFDTFMGIAVQHYTMYAHQYSSAEIYGKFNASFVILYAPKDEFTAKLFKSVQSKLHLTDENILSFTNDISLFAYYQNHVHDFTYAVLFPDLISKQSSGKNLKYTIMPCFQFTMPSMNQLLVDLPGFYGGPETYLETGFLGLQMALDTSYIEVKTSRDLPYELSSQDFPAPAKSIYDGSFIYKAFPMVTMLSFCFHSSDILQRVVEEKSRGIKELMKMMGLKSETIWFGWFCYIYMHNLITIILMTCILKMPLVLQGIAVEQCDIFLLFFLLLLNGMASISFAFVISVCFNTPSGALNYGLIIWILAYLVPYNVLNKMKTMNWILKLLLTVFPNISIYHSFETLAAYNRRKVKLTWWNFHLTADGSNNDVTTAYVIIMTLFAIIAHISVASYIESVFPGRYGIPKPFSYPVMYLIRKFGKKNYEKEYDEESDSQPLYTSESAPNLKVAIRIKNVYKTFAELVAVNNLSVNIYEHEITALLGHNGAGKTLTLAMLTGMTTMSSGQIIVNGRDTRYNFEEVHKSMGFCPQDNLHFEELSLIQHLLFFGMVKGWSISKAHYHAKLLLRQLQLYDARHDLPSKLSYGMQRRLSLAIALTGGPKIIILDEPTAGIDPEARRGIWDILLALRGYRTILITMQFIEEADILADRIIIMNHGKIACYGTSMFLKKEYGEGYCLKIVRQSSLNASQIQKITDNIQKKITDAVLHSSSGNVLTYLLPYSMKSRFSGLLQVIETNKDALGITNISLSVATLEDVFLRVGNPEQDKTHNEFVFTLDTSSKSSGIVLLILQIQALFLKHWYYFIHTWLNYVIVVFVLLQLMILALYLAPAATPGAASEAKFQLPTYGKTDVFYGETGSDPELTKIEQSYDKLIKEQNGKPLKVHDVTEEILKAGENNMAYYFSTLVVAAEFNASTKSLNAMQSFTAVHGAPISLNLLMNAIARGMYDTNSSIEVSISLLKNKEYVTTDRHTSQGSLFSFGLTFLATMFLKLPYIEKSTKLKRLQFNCGVHALTYWLTNFVFDLILYLISVFAVIMFIAVFDIYNFTIYFGRKQYFVLIDIFVSYGLSAIPFMYLFSYAKSLHAPYTYYITLACISNFIARIPVNFPSLANLRFLNLLCVIPPYGVTNAILRFFEKTMTSYKWNINSPQEKELICKQGINISCCLGENDPKCIEYLSYYGGTYSISDVVIIMRTSCIIYFAIILLMESNCIRKYWQKITLLIVGAGEKDKTKDIEAETARICEVLKQEKIISTEVNAEEEIDEGDESDEDDEEDEEDEDDEVSETLDEDDQLLVYNLQKTYGANKIVRSLSFGVKPGDCFGLLGVDGDGKTTTFRLLSGDLPLSVGEVRILTPTNEKIYLSKNRRKFLKKVGYCPQADAIIEELTGRQMLTIFAKLRGVSHKVKDEVDKYLRALGLEEYADKQSGNYSGGNKRKLCVAMALIAAPPIILLDEPTASVDPVSRRKLWNILTGVQDQEVNKPSIVLTSHSMEECEALCTRLGIMKDGRMECCGTILNLKKKYIQGFTVTLKLQFSDTTNRSRRPSVDAVEELMLAFEKKFKDCVLKDKHAALLQYHIYDTKIQLSHLFKKIEKLKAKFSIVEDYVISETTLEEVFIAITKANPFFNIMIQET